MPRRAQNDMRRLSAILVAGAVAGLGASYVASRKRPETAGNETRLIDWNLVRRVSMRAARSNEAPVHNRVEAQAEYTDMVRRSEPLIARYLGVDLPNPVERIRVVDRAEWLEANIFNFSGLFRFIEDIYREHASVRTVGGAVASGVNQRLMSIQVGVLLGVLARKVLGQYDLSLLAPEPTAGALYFVEPNIGRVQNMLGLNAHDFRLWIALHETTHAYEFEAYPWVRDHFNSLLQRYFDQLNHQLQSLKGGLGALLQRIIENWGKGQHWMEMVLTPDQRKVFVEMQALMSLVEGYSNHIMNAIGKEILPNFEEIERRIEERKAGRPVLEQLFNRITGMDLKLAQYAEGQKFVDTVVDKRGVAYANRAWQRAENLPTLDEIRNPDRWIARIDAY
ncbi:MAG TPA: zinc-dependent metalloprotease [Herpetosiphonaceae bacterium]|nr:zinc-dependent metalloprotease [Herpetosiphonaceae bacterium]